jgi:hypothetical protein
MGDPLEPGSIHWRQSEALKRLLGEDTPTGHLSWYEAAGLIKLHDPDAAWRREPASPRQEAFLKERGLWRQALSKGEASALIGEALRKGSVPW